MASELSCLRPGSTGRLRWVGRRPNRGSALYRPHITEVVEMNKRSLALKVLAAEALLIAGLGSLAFLYARSVNEASTKSLAAPVEAPNGDDQAKESRVVAVDYGKAKEIAELAKTIAF